MKVELDKKALFALASDNRIEILKELQTSRKTISQLAGALSIDKAAVHRHLKKLEEGEFVVRHEDHGFVYYGLSWKARDIISPGENTRIVIVFCLTWVMALSAVSAFAVALASTAQNAVGKTDNSPMSGSNSFLEGTSHFNPELYAIAAVLVIGAVVMAYLGYRRYRRPRQKGNEGDDDLGGSERSSPAFDGAD